MRSFARLLTLGHGLALALVVTAVYFAWGTVFQSGGTGSNVVLGLLIALALIWVGAQQIGPLIDEAVASPERRKLLRVRRAAFELAREVRRAVIDARKDKRNTRDPAALAALLGLAEQLDEAERMPTVTASKLEDLTNQVDKEAQLLFPSEKVGPMGQAKGLAFAFAVALALRAFFVAPFQIPSGSMIPTLLIGDHLFVFRGMYGLQSPVGKEPSYLVRWSLPKPGDVVVFEAPPWVPANAGEDWIKRVVAGAGQRVKQVGTVVHVDGRPYAQVSADGQAATDQAGHPVGVLTRYMDYEGEQQNRWYEATASHKRETIVRPDGTTVEHSVFNNMPPGTSDWPRHPGASTGLRCTPEECVVEDGFVFVMGDNRDRSSDGRVWGAVPVDNIKGKALFIWVSVDGSGSSVKLGRFTLPRFRWSRIGDVIP